MQKNSSVETCEESIRQAAKSQTGAAVLGGVLSMAGGFGGRGGMAVGQAGAIGSSVVQEQARSKSREAIEKECS